MTLALLKPRRKMAVLALAWLGCAESTQPTPDAGADAGPSLDVAADPWIFPADTHSPDAPATDTAAVAEDSGLDGDSCALLETIPADLPSIDFAAYHTLDQMLAYLRSVAVAAPSVATYNAIGISKRGRELGTLTINATCLPHAPAVFFNGAHHGDEGSSAEATLALADTLLRRSATDASVRDLLQTYSFTIMPVVNPDGFAANTRVNADGEDINRDYPYPGRSENDSFKTREASLVKYLQESQEFVGAIAFHSGSEEVLWPWCYIGTGTADEAFFLAAGKKAAAAMGVSVFQQSYDDYPTQGEYIDYAYAKSRTLAATFEVSSGRRPDPSLLAGVVERANQGAVAWVQAMSDRVAGHLHALPAGPRPKFPFTAPFDGHDRLE
jgi:hypothetical protein